jgi:hypothetical protein
VLSFAIVALFVRESPPVDTRARLSLHIPGLAWIAGAARVVSVVLFVVALLAGFFGAQDPYRNVIVTVVWVAWWVGFAFACALIGNLWRPLNPLAALFAWAERATRGRLSLGVRYPPWLGVWPAVILFFCFAWAELVWRDKDVPLYLARAVLAYSVLAWAGMVLFGRERWLERGEAFSLAFGVLGRFGPLDTRANALRFPGAGLGETTRVPFSFVIFVLLMLATVTFDGFLETPLHQALATQVQSSTALARLLFRLSEFGVDEDAAISTVALVAFPVLFLAAYWLASWVMHALTGKSTVTDVACAFVLTLVPIAVAYHLSHYFSLLVTAGQFIIPLASDPFGYGWNLFGSAGYKVNLAIASPYVFWYGAVTLVVVGHVIAVYLAHTVALREFGSRRLALLSQAPMLALMVGYTMLSLWILAQPIVG